MDSSVALSVMYSLSHIYLYHVHPFEFSVQCVSPQGISAAFSDPSVMTDHDEQITHHLSSRSLLYSLLDLVLTSLLL